MNNINSPNLRSYKSIMQLDGMTRFFLSPLPLQTDHDHNLGPHLTSLKLVVFFKFSIKILISFVVNTFFLIVL